ncbi:MAG: methyltransferase domain-containing protein [Candidatus Lokiarchaeota archaeon]|nr:methyltransferase domain-containing protein [Candidatus Lokiarchaeota archaeon]
MKKSFDYEEKKKKELEWYNSLENQSEKKGFIRKILYSPIFWSNERREYSYSYGKRRMFDFINRKIDKKVERLLIAPVGYGDDYGYVKDFAKHIYGIDLSEKATKYCPKEISIKIGDILNTEYPNNYFDIIVSSLFFHHIVSVGFVPYLNEFNRILKEGGLFVILDFSKLYPLNAFTKPIKKICQNPFAEIEDEEPFRPKFLLESLEKTNFVDINWEGANFSHCSIPIPIAKVINFLTEPIINNKFLSRFAWLVLYSARKN